MLASLSQPPVDGVDLGVGDICSAHHFLRSICDIVAGSTVIFAFIGKAPGDSSTLRTAVSERFHLLHIHRGSAADTVTQTASAASGRDGESAPVGNTASAFAFQESSVLPLWDSQPRLQAGSTGPGPGPGPSDRAQTYEGFLWFCFCGPGCPGIQLRRL